MRRHMMILLLASTALCLVLSPTSPEPINADASEALAQDQSQAADGRQALPQLAIQLKAGTTPSELLASSRAISAEVIFADWALLRFADLPKMEGALETLIYDNRVLAYERQYQSRDIKKTNDPFFTNQYHLKNTGQFGGLSGTDVNAEGAWGNGFTGNGVVVGVIDDGIELAHEDLVSNANTALSRDVLDNDSDPSPVGAGDDHGTAVAGLITASANNNLGGAGVAYGAQLSGLRMLGSGQSDAVEAAALGYLPDSIDIYNNSWGPPDDGNYHRKLGLPVNAIRNGVAAGRGGLGSIYTWACGNGGNGDWSNLDGFANMPETIAVGSIGRTGLRASYSEKGANVFCVTPGGTSDVTTTDRMGLDGYNDGTLFANPNYTNDFSGTSSSTPMASGVIALMLEANPLLSWRDVQHIIARTSLKVNSGDAGWKTNSANFEFNHGYGFGLLNAQAATTLAQNWLPIGTRRAIDSAVDIANVPIPDATPTGLIRTITFDPQIYLEHVEVDIVSNHVLWGDLVITLTSPDGTVSQLSDNTFGTSPSGNTYRFMTVANWGEQSNGTWALKVADIGSGDIGNLASWKITFYGTDEEVSSTGGVPPTANLLSVANAEEGDEITILGINLSDAEVEIGGVPAVVLSNTTNTVVVRIGVDTPEGMQDVTVTTPAGESMLSIFIDPPTPAASINSSGGGGGGCSLSSFSEESSLVFALILVLMAYSRRRRRRQASNE